MGLTSSLHLLYWKLVKDIAAFKQPSRMVKIRMQSIHGHEVGLFLATVLRAFVLCKSCISKNG